MWIQCVYAGPLIRQYSRPSCTRPGPHQFIRGTPAPDEQKLWLYCLISETNLPVAPSEAQLHLLLSDPLSPAAGKDAGRLLPVSVLLPLAALITPLLGPSSPMLPPPTALPAFILSLSPTAAAAGTHEDQEVSAPAYFDIRRSIAVTWPFFYY